MGGPWHAAACRVVGTAARMRSWRETRTMRFAWRPSSGTSCAPTLGIA